MREQGRAGHSASRRWSRGCTVFQTMFQRGTGLSASASVVISKARVTAGTIFDSIKLLLTVSFVAERLSGHVEIDDAYLGGERSQRGRGSLDNTPFVLAVWAAHGRKPHQVVIRCWPFQSEAVR